MIAKTFAFLLLLLVLAGAAIGASGCTAYVEENSSRAGEREMDLHIQGPPERIEVKMPKVPDKVNIHMEHPALQPRTVVKEVPAEASE